MEEGRCAKCSKVKKLEQRFGYKCSPDSQECAVPGEAVPSEPPDASRKPKTLLGHIKGHAKGLLGHVGKVIKQIICLIPIFPCSTKKNGGKGMVPKIPTPFGKGETAPDTKEKEQVGSDDRNTPEIGNKWGEPIHANGVQVVMWSTTQFCERVVDHFGPKAVKYQKAKEPAAQFIDDCTIFLGLTSGCMPQCLSLSGLYDEASRPGGENGNIWERTSQRWDYERNIPIPDVKADPSARTIAYSMTVKDCKKCVLYDNCVPECLYDGSCEADDSIPIG
jgi:hypothetical protein